MNNNSIAKRTIVLGSDHAGFKLKQILIDYLKSMNSAYEIVDVGTDSDKSVDYPDYAFKLCDEVLKGKENRGILVCGSGIGVSISANKVNGIRCGLVHDYTTAK